MKSETSYVAILVTLLARYNPQSWPCDVYDTDHQRRMCAFYGQLDNQLGERGWVHTTHLITGLDEKTRMKGILILKSDTKF